MPQTLNRQARQSEGDSPPIPHAHHRIDARRPRRQLNPPPPLTAVNRHHDFALAGVEVDGFTQHKVSRPDLRERKNVVANLQPQPDVRRIARFDG